MGGRGDSAPARRRGAVDGVARGVRRGHPAGEAMSVGCGRCEGTPGWEPVEVEGVKRLRRCGCWTAAHAAPPSVPREFREARWSTWRKTGDNRHALDEARTFVRAGDGGRDLFLCGPVGTGKTRLACTVLNELWRSGERLMAFERVPMLLYRLQPHGTAAETAEDFNRLVAAKLQVLDDLGAERDAATDYTRRTLLMLYAVTRVGERVHPDAALEPGEQTCDVGRTPAVEPYRHRGDAADGGTAARRGPWPSRPRCPSHRRPRRTSRGRSTNPGGGPSCPASTRSCQRQRNRTRR